MKQTFSLILLIFLTQSLDAQISTPGTPPSWSQNLSPISTQTLPLMKIQKLLDEDALEQNMPQRFGKKQRTKWSLSNSGTWDQLANGDRVWRLRVVGRNAKSINFLLSQFRIPVGAKLYAYNDDHSYKVGAFTSNNHQPDFGFAIAPVRGEAVTLEYYEPAAVAGQGHITISHVIQAYRDLFRMANDVTRDYGDAGACNIDVACPQASPWTDQVRSVGLIIVGGSRNCTGTLLNNTAQDGTPYFLTANHCMGAAVPGTLLSNWVFVFNYDSPTCGGVDGTLLDGITGGVVRAAYDDADMALLELNSSPPASYNTYFAGWNRADIASDSCTGISHPRGDVKKIAFNRNPLISVQGPGAVDHFWEVTEWEMGTTEPTSSGSGLFDPNGRVIGQLFGGSASCSNNTGYDQYGKIAKSWEGSGTPASRLKDWLDPSQSNDTTIDGTYTFSLPRWDIGVVSISSINSQNCDSIINPILTIRNFGSETITKVDITYDYGLGSSLFQWTGSLTSRNRVQVNLPPSSVLPVGAYQFSVSLGDPNDSTDVNPANNQSSRSFTIISGKTLNIEFFTDGFPEESSYDLYKMPGRQLVHQASTFQGTSLNLDVQCLTVGCYRLVLKDAAGDGLVGNPSGWLRLTGAGGVLIDSIGPVFTDSAVVSFCLPIRLHAAVDVPSEVCRWTDVTLVNRSTLATTFDWSIPGANPPTSTDRNPRFMFSRPGAHSGRLIASDNAGNSDTSTFVIQVGNGFLFDIELTTDNFPEETSIFVFDNTGAEVFRRTNFPAVGTYIEKLCLAEGCYDFRIDDSSGDGICCDFGNGSYTLRNAVGTTLAQGGQFANTATHNFCLSPGTAVDPLRDISINIQPNPSDGIFRISSSERIEMLEVFDLQGRSILKKYPSSTKTQINLTSFTNGLYMLQISTPHGKLNRKLVRY